MLLLISICRLVYAHCFSLLVAVCPESGSSRVAGFCIGVEMSRDIGIPRAKVHLIIGIYTWLVTASGDVLTNGVTRPHIHACSLSLLPIKRRDRCISIQMSLRNRSVRIISPCSGPGLHSVIKTNSEGTTTGSSLHLFCLTFTVSYRSISQSQDYCVKN